MLIHSKSTVRKVNRVIELAKALKGTKQTGNNFHVTAIYDKNKIISIGHNDYRKPHPEKKYGAYKPTRHANSKYVPCRHSEISSLVNGGIEDGRDFTFINVRIDNSGNVALAKPCTNCFNVINKQIGFKHLFYTTDANGGIGAANT